MKPSIRPLLASFANRLPPSLAMRNLTTCSLLPSDVCAHTGPKIVDHTSRSIAHTSTRWNAFPQVLTPAPLTAVSTHSLQSCARTSSRTTPAVFQPLLAYARRSFSSTTPAAALSPSAPLLSRPRRLLSEQSPSPPKKNGRTPSSSLWGRAKSIRKALGSSNIWSSGGGGGGRRPPSRSSGIFAKMDAKLAKYPDSTFIYALFLINAVIFLVMLYADQSFKKYADPRLAITMYKHFMCSMQNLQEGRWWTLLTSSLAHRDPMHILFNMVTLGFMAPPVLALTGPSTFLALYFGGSLVSNVVSLLAKTLLHDGQHARVPSMGASGSIYALMTTFACVHPHATFLIFFVLPAPAWAVVGGIFAYDAFRSFAEPGIRTDTAGHVGGILTGLLFWRFGLRGIRI